MRTCAVCGWKDAVKMTRWDERYVPACGECGLEGDAQDFDEAGRLVHAEAVDSPFARPARGTKEPSRMRLVADTVARLPGKTSLELGLALGVPPGAATADRGARLVYGRYRTALLVAVRKGMVREERAGGIVRYYPGEVSQ